MKLLVAGILLLVCDFGQPHQKCNPQCNETQCCALTLSFHSIISPFQYRCRGLQQEGDSCHYNRNDPNRTYIISCPCAEGLQCSRVQPISWDGKRGLFGFVSTCRKDGSTTTETTSTETTTTETTSTETTTTNVGETTVGETTSTEISTTNVGETTVGEITTEDTSSG